MTTSALCISAQKSPPQYDSSLRALCCLLLLLLARQPSFGQPPADGPAPNTFSNISAAQLQQVAEAAGRNGLQPVTIDAKTIGREVRFHVEFTQRPNTVRWAIVINAPAKRIRTEDIKFRKNGYERTLTERVRVGREIVTTAVWTRKAKSPQPLVLPQQPIPVSGDPVAGFEPVDEYFTDFLKTFNAAGASVAIAYQGNLVYERAFGYSDVAKKKALQPDETLRIASVSKTITSAAILRLVQQRKLALDDRIVPLLEKKSLRLPTGSDPRWQDITVRHLLQHSGGWQQALSGDPLFQVVEITAAFGLKKSASFRHLIRYQMKRPLDFNPGSRVAYNNFGFLLLGRIVEAVTDKDYPDAVSELVLQPAEMQHTLQGRTPLRLKQSSEPIYHMQTTTFLAPYWTSLDDFSRGDSTFAEDVPDPYGRWKLELMDSAGGWLSTASDLVTFATALDADTEPLLSPLTIQDLISQPATGPERSSSLWTGLGWTVWSPFREEPTNLKHVRISLNGSLAGSSTVLSHSSADWTFAVLFNCDESQDGTKLSFLANKGLTEALEGCKIPASE
ncbi:MAG: serine hydrolase domain-containing protein [Fuerstiella sp.]